MRARPLPLLVVALLAAPLAASAQGTSRGKGGGRAAHPTVNVGEACADCHAQATPAVYREWSKGEHGINLVKCFVCHGSTGADFRARPAAERCAGCHADEVATMRGPAMKGKSCFSCHSPHALDPHATAGGESSAAALGADRLAPMETVEGRIPPPGPTPGGPPAGAGAPASAAPPASGAGTGASALPGAEKDLTDAQRHPPTSR